MSTPPTDGYGAELTNIVERGRRGALSLRALSPQQRVAHFPALREAILRLQEEIVDLVAEQTHKARSDIVMSEIFGALDAIAWCEKNAAKALADDKVPTPLTMLGKKSRVWYEPRGVVLIISPWNYPFFQAIVPIVQALAAGNAVVYKPSEWTPLAGIIETLLQAAAIAPNWVQIAYGTGDVAAEIIDQRPDQIMFTGSPRTGRAILRRAAEHLIPVELELGGKDAMIVFDDVQLPRTAAGAAFGALTALGQSCTSVERLYVQQGIFDDFIAELVSCVNPLVQRADGDNNTDLGAMTTPAQVEIVARHVADATARGATFHTGGDWDGKDPLIPPMVITDLPTDALMATEETFGPVIPVFAFSDEAEVIDRANDTPYGLTASVWSNDLDRAERVARALRCGGVSINNVMATEATQALPFGGLGESGMGRYKGTLGLRTFSNVKSVVIDKDGDKLEANWFPYTDRKYRMFNNMMRALFCDGKGKLAKFGVHGTRLENYAQRAARRDR